MKQKELDIRIKELYFKQTVSIKDNDKGRVDLAKREIQTLGILK